MIFLTRPSVCNDYKFIIVLNNIFVNPNPVEQPVQNAMTVFFFTGSRVAARRAP
jgi:hypothetical protein